MKIIRTASSKKLVISKKEWQAIGRTAGWDRSPEEIERLKQAKKEAIETANIIKEKFGSLGYEVSDIKVTETAFIKTIKDSDGVSHNVDIELKPWANKNNNKYELRGGVIIMAGPYAHKRFKRKRFSPKNVDKMISFLKRVFKYTSDMEKLRQKRSEKAEQARAEKFETAMQSQLT